MLVVSQEIELKYALLVVGQKTMETAKLPTLESLKLTTKIDILKSNKKGHNDKRI